MPKNIKINMDELLELKVRYALGLETKKEIIDTYGISYQTLNNYLEDNEKYTPEDIKEAVALYRRSIIDAFIETKDNEITMRQQIVIRGLMKLRDKITFTKSISAKVLSDVISQQQKDLWTSLGQPSEILSSAMSDVKIKEAIESLQNIKYEESTNKQSSDSEERKGEGRVSTSVERQVGEAIQRTED